MTLTPVEATVAPHPEILYQAADPKRVRSPRIVGWATVAIFAPVLGLVALLGLSIWRGTSSPILLGTTVIVLPLLLGFSVSLAFVRWAVNHPAPPPAITQDGVLVYPWLPFGDRSPVEHRFDGQRTIKGYRAGENTVIELHPPSGRPTIATVFDPDGVALKLVREAAVKSGSAIAEPAQALPKAERPA